MITIKDTSHNVTTSQTEIFHNRFYRDLNNYLKKFMNRNSGKLVVVYATYENYTRTINAIDLIDNKMMLRQYALAHTIEFKA